MFQHRELEHALTDTADMMVIDARSHEGPGYQERFGRVHPVLIKNRLAAGRLDQVPDQPLGIHCTVRGAGIIGIAEKVVHPVNIEIPVYDPGEMVLSPHNTAQLSRIDTMVPESGSGITRTHDPPDIIVPRTEVLFHQRLACMRERAVPDIMEESGRNHERPFLPWKAKPPGRHIGKEHGTKGMLKARVVRPGVHEVRKPELPDIAESLERGGVEQGEGEILHFHVPVDRVLDDLQVH